MGKSSVAVNNFVKRPHIAADLFNGVVDEGGKVNMCPALQEIWDKGMEKGKVSGAMEKLKEIVSKKLQKGHSIEAIAEMLEESVDVIAGLVKELQQ